MNAFIQKNFYKGEWANYLTQDNRNAESNEICEIKPYATMQ